MNSIFFTNQLEYEINRAVFSQEYDVFSFETSDMYFKSSDALLGVLKADKNIRAILNQYDKNVYLLMDKNGDNEDKLKELLSRIENKEKYFLHLIDIGEMGDISIIRLMFNALDSCDSNFFVSLNMLLFPFMVSSKFFVYDESLN